MVVFEKVSALDAEDVELVVECSDRKLVCEPLDDGADIGDTGPPFRFGVMDLERDSIRGSMAGGRFHAGIFKACRPLACPSGWFEAFVESDPLSHSLLLLVWWLIWLLAPGDTADGESEAIP
jgi:hypothetical protein